MKFTNDDVLYQCVAGHVNFATTINFNPSVIAIFALVDIDEWPF